MILHRKTRSNPRHVTHDMYISWVTSNISWATCYPRHVSPTTCKSKTCAPRHAPTTCSCSPRHDTHDMHPRHVTDLTLLWHNIALHDMFCSPRHHSTTCSKKIPRGFLISWVTPQHVMGNTCRGYMSWVTCRGCMCDMSWVTHVVGDMSWVTSTWHVVGNIGHVVGNMDCTPRDVQNHPRGCPWHVPTSFVNMSWMTYHGWHVMGNMSWVHIVVTCHG